MPVRERRGHSHDCREMRRMRTFSEKLREARESKGLTLEELASSTKISLRVLRAVEAGDFEVLPQTYVRGFLKTYATEVGLDPVQVVRDFEAHVKTTSEIFAQPRGMEKARSRTLSPFIWGGVICALAVVGIAFLVLGPQNEHPDQTPRESEEDLVSLPVVYELPTGADSVTAVDSTEDLSQQNAGEKTESEGEGAIRVSEGVEPIRVTLRAEAVSDTWLHVLADGNEVYKGIMNTGTSALWRADSIFEMKIGKADGLRLLLNGKPLGPLGGPDTVVSTLVLDKNGIVRKILR